MVLGGHLNIASWEANHLSVGRSFAPQPLLSPACPWNPLRLPVTCLPTVLPRLIYFSSFISPSTHPFRSSAHVLSF